MSFVRTTKEERAAARAKVIAETAAALPEAKAFVIKLGFHAFEKLVEMGKTRDAYPTDEVKQIVVGLWAHDALFTGKHRIAKVSDNVAIVRDAMNLGLLPVLTY